MGFSGAFGGAGHLVARDQRGRLVAAIVVVSVAVLSGCQAGEASSEAVRPSQAGVQQEQTDTTNAVPSASEEALAGYVQKVADLYEERYQGLEIQGVNEFTDAVRMAPSNPVEAANILTGLGVTQKSIEINDKLYKEACSDPSLVDAYEFLGGLCPNDLSSYLKSTNVVEFLLQDFDYTIPRTAGEYKIPTLVGLISQSDIEEQQSDISSQVSKLIMGEMKSIGDLNNTPLTAANKPEEMGIENWLNALLTALPQVNHENSPVVKGISNPEQKKAWGDQYEKIVNGAIQIVKEYSKG